MSIHGEIQAAMNPDQMATGADDGYGSDDRRWRGDQKRRNAPQKRRNKDKDKGVHRRPAGGRGSGGGNERQQKQQQPTTGETVNWVKFFDTSNTKPAPVVRTLPKSPKATPQEPIQPREVAQDPETLAYEGKPAQQNGADEAQMKAAQKNPAYKTLFHAKSNVFDVKQTCQFKPKASMAGTIGAPAPAASVSPAGETQMKAAQMNPAYKTLWGAKTGVFDRPPDGGGRSVADEGRMKAAQANPAYRTLWGAKTGVFDKQTLAPQAAPPDQSTGYR